MLHCALAQYNFFVSFLPAALFNHFNFNYSNFFLRVFNIVLFNWKDYLAKLISIFNSLVVSDFPHENAENRKYESYYWWNLSAFMGRLNVCTERKQNVLTEIFAYTISKVIEQSVNYNKLFSNRNKRSWIRIKSVMYSSCKTYILEEAIIQFHWPLFFFS